MTTLIGIKADRGKPGIVLASDMQGTHSGYKSVEAGLLRVQEKYDIPKIHIDGKRENAIAMAGSYDMDFKKYLSRFIHNELNIKDAIKNGFSEDTLKLNINRWGGKLNPEAGYNELLLATRIDENPRLYRFHSMGLVEEAPIITLGSGQDLARSYIEEFLIDHPDMSVPQYITLNDAMDLAWNAIRSRAHHDIGTGKDTDLVVVTKDAVRRFGPENYARSLDDALLKEFRAFQKNYDLVKVKK